MAVNPVIICDLDEAVQSLPDLISKTGFKLETVHLALVKPNLCGLYHPSLRLLSSIIEFLMSFADSVVIGETRSMMHDPDEQFQRLGVNALLKEYAGRVKAVDLSDDQSVKVRVPNPHALRELTLPKTILDSDVLVNLPKVGTHSTTRLTCALKNLFGLLPQKHKYLRYHPLGMSNVIADIAQVVKSDLNIVDGGSKVILGLDALVVDIVACRFLNLDPLRVEHLRLVSEDRGEKLEAFLRKIKVVEI